MLESSGRRLLVFVPLLIGACTQSVSTAGEVPACSTVFDRTFEVGVSPCSAQALGSSMHLRSYDIRMAVTDLLKPPAEVTGMVSSSFHPRSLPAVPRPILMVALGFLCVSLVHDRRIWLAAAACLLPLGHHRPTVIPGPSSQPRVRRQLGHLALRGVPTLFMERVPLCVRVHPVLTVNVSHEEVAGTSYAVVHPPSALNRLLPCRIANADPVGFVSSQLPFAQLARGPPSRTWKT